MSTKLSAASLITAVTTAVSRVVMLNVFTYKSDYSLVSMGIWKYSWLIPTLKTCTGLRQYDTGLFCNSNWKLELCFSVDK